MTLTHRAALRLRERIAFETIPELFRLRTAVLEHLRLPQLVRRGANAPVLLHIKQELNIFTTDLEADHFKKCKECRLFSGPQSPGFAPGLFLSIEKRLRPTALTRAVRLLCIATLRGETAPIRSQTRFAPTLHLARAAGSRTCFPRPPGTFPRCAVAGLQRLRRAAQANWRSAPSATRMPASG